MTFELKHGSWDIACNGLDKKEMDRSFSNCVEDDLQLLGWIRQLSFDPNPDLDARLLEAKDVVEKYYLRALVGINDLGVANVANRALAYKVQLITFLVEAIRKYGKYEI